MGKRGPKSATGTAIAKLAEDASNFNVINYPEPPYELADNEIQIWNSVVRDCAPEWFSPRNLGLLKQYCRHMSAADHLAELIRGYREDMRRRERGQATMDDLDGMEYRDLLQMQAAETRAIANLAVKMRIAQQSTIDPVSSRKKVGKGSKPIWEA